jgi:dTDP-4-dehydrorhamnose 3,5-epimerase
MHFDDLSVSGAFLIEPERIEGERGFFTRAWRRRDLKSHGIRCDRVQCNISFNNRRGTLRGLHYQSPPRAEAKLVRWGTLLLFTLFATRQSHSLLPRRSRVRENRPTA